MNFCRYIKYYIETFKILSYRECLSKTFYPKLSEIYLYLLFEIYNENLVKLIKKIPYCHFCATI